jgi:hypothetical protein
MYRHNPYLEKLSDSTLLGLLLFAFGGTVVFFSYGISSPWFRLFVVTFFAAEEAFLYSPTSLSMRESVRRWSLAHPSMRPTQPWDVTHPWLVKGVVILLLSAVVALYFLFQIPINILAGVIGLAFLSQVAEEFFRRLSATSFPVSKTWTD